MALPLDVIWDENLAKALGVPIAKLSWKCYNSFQKVWVDAWICRVAFARRLLAASIRHKTVVVISFEVCFWYNIIQKVND